MTTPIEEAAWLPVAQQIVDRWGVHHASLVGTIAIEIAGIVAEERERCAKIAEWMLHPGDSSLKAANDRIAEAIRAHGQSENSK